MNLLVKDKYRTKIMEHLLHQSSTQESSQNPCHQPQILQQNQQHTSNCYQGLSKSKIFEKVKNTKPLIEDGQATQRQRQINFNKLTSGDIVKPKENSQNKLNFNDPNKFSTHQSNENIQNMSIKGHLKKQSYIFHQKLPIMQASNMQGNEILKKLKKNIKTKQLNQNKQNISGNFNSVRKSQKQKENKYRFVVSNKVIEALNLRKTERQNKEQGCVQQNEKTETPLNVNSFHQAKRSKGSKQMMEFLQSAREKLFQNMNKNNIESIQVSEKLSIKPVQVYTVEQIGNYSFKIEIQVSSNKTIEIILNLNCDPKKVARDFIEQNKGELQSYHGLQFQRLQGLLSKKINAQIQKQRRLFSTRQQKECHTIDHASSSKKMQIQRSSNQTLRIKNDRLQFSHVYVQNIDTDMTNQQYALQIRSKQIFDNGKNANRRSIINDEMLNNKQDGERMSIVKQSRQITLGGYINSPHQLITYRADSTSFQTGYEKQFVVDTRLQSEEVCVSHFPLSKQIAYNLNSFHQNPPDEIGADKILSKSRSKLNKKQQLQTVQKCPQQPSMLPQHPQVQQYPPTSDQQTILCKNQEFNIKPYPSINSTSSKIVAKLGKQNILTSVKEKQITKRQKILKQRQQKLIKQMKECSFKPKINNLSKSIDKNKKKKVKILDLLQNDLQNQHQRLKKNQKSQFPACEQQNLQSQNEQNHQNQISSFDKILSKLQQPQKRYQELYENYKTIQTKKQIIRQKSIQEIKFKPQINSISKKIMESKRNSLNNSICPQYNSLANSKISTNRHQSACKKSSKRNSVQINNEIHNNYNHENQDSRQLMKKRKSLNVSRNMQGLEIGEYLYKQAMKMKKRKELQQERKIENFKPLDKSQKITLNLRQTRLSQYFDQLLGIQKISQNDQNYNFVLSPCSFSLSQQRFSYVPLRYLVPLLQQLKDLQVSLTRDQFIESGMKLINTLSQDEKMEFLKMRKKWNEGLDQQYMQGQPCLNKLSLELMDMKQDYVHDIYQRGVEYKRQIKEKVEYDMEDKVRRELEKCTFKPIINPLNYRYSK